jgi:HlyD family secretion protein
MLLPRPLAGIESGRHTTSNFVQSWPFVPAIRPLCLAAAASILLLSACSGVPPPAAQGSSSVITDSRTARVERRDFHRTLRFHGTVEAIQSYSVNAPRLSGQSAAPMVITKLVRNGTHVHRGDVLVEFDRQNQMKTVLDREAEYKDLLQQIRKKEADQAAARARDETEIKAAEYDLQAARVDMRKNDVVTSIEAEKNRQNLAEAEAKLAQLPRTLALKRESAAAEFRILQIQRERALNAMNYARRNIELMGIQSPLEGLAVLTPIYKMSRMADPQEGDEVRPGQPLLLVVNPAAMQVRARINQLDRYYLKLGQHVEIHLDAYPDLVFPGTVERLGAVGASSDFSRSQIRYFIALISIKGSDPKLLPDLSAAADVELEKLENALVLPRESVVIQNGESMVEVLNEGRSEMRRVQIGPMNDCEVVIASGIHEGTIVARAPRIARSAGVPK